MKLLPCNDYVVIKMDDVEDTTKSGIFLPNEANYKLTRGRVEGIGKDVTEVAVGDHVCMSQYTGTELETDDGQRLMLKEKDILMVLGD